MKNIVFLLAILMSITSSAQDLDTFITKADEFFGTYVKNGRVDYGSIKNNPEKLEELLEIGTSVKVNVSEANKFQAFWINAYNLGVIKGIIDNYPTNSPLSHAGFFDKTTYDFGGKSVTLNGIENDILRAKFKDPRVHFVLVCGAIGCPPIIGEAYKPNILQQQLDKQTRLAINGNYFIKVNTKKKKISGSEILKWYKEDFTLNGTDEIDFFNRYRTEPLSKDFKISYFSYNWNLNDQ